MNNENLDFKVDFSQLKKQLDVIFDDYKQKYVIESEKMNIPFPSKIFLKNGKGEVEYFIDIATINRKTHTETIYSLFYSNSIVWTENVKEKCIMKIIDTGDVIKISKNFKKMDYSEALYLELLLIICRKNFPFSTKFAVIDENEKIIDVI